MDKTEIMKHAMADTASKPDQTAPSNTDESPFAQDDGTVTIPKGILPEGIGEGDIVQFTFVTETEEGVVLKPVESRIKQDGVGAEDAKAAGPDNSMAVGTNPGMAQK